MSSFATLSEAWGMPESPYVQPVERSRAQMTGNTSFVLGGESIAGISKVESMSEVERDAFVRQYLAGVYRRSGVRGVCKLAGPKICKKIRDAYLFDFSRDEILIAILVVLVVVLAFRLNAK